MVTKLMEMDSDREVRMEARGGTLFLWGRGFSYEFNGADFLEVVQKELSVA